MNPIFHLKDMCSQITIIELQITQDLKFVASPLSTGI